MIKKLVDDVLGCKVVHYEKRKSGSHQWRDQFLYFDSLHPRGILISFEEWLEIMDSNPNLQLMDLRSSMIIWMAESVNPQELRKMTINSKVSSYSVQALGGYLNLNLNNPYQIN